MLRIVPIRRSRTALLAVALSFAAVERLAAQAMIPAPFGIPATRQGSGTSWLPDSSAMHAIHRTWGAWSVMFHGSASLLYNHQGSDRGDRQLGLVDWEMVMASRRVGAGVLRLNAMTSLEPAILGGRGYPLLLQSGESYRGEPLHDRQHPHDLVMELSALYERPVTSGIGASLYAAVSGEPALGPVAYMHRPSAQNDPLAPLGHHWQDATHITFGVLTAGVFTRHWKLEGSVFNGREPDENRWNVDLGGRRLDSWATRLTVNPSGRWSVAGWYGYLESPEALHPDEPVRRFGLAAQHAGATSRGAWDSALIWSANNAHGATQHSLLLESNLELGPQHVVFGRVERVRKSAEELVIEGAPDDLVYDITSLAGGFVRHLTTVSGLALGAGVRGSVNFIPPTLEPAYGTRAPAGVAIFLQLRPRGTSMPGHDTHIHHAPMPD